MCSFYHRLQSTFVSFFAVLKTRWRCKTPGKLLQLYIERIEESPRSALLTHVPFYLDPWGAGETSTKKKLHFQEGLFTICFLQLHWATDMKSIFKENSTWSSDTESGMNIGSDYTRMFREIMSQFRYKEIRSETVITGFSEQGPSFVYSFSLDCKRKA